MDQPGNHILLRGNQPAAADRMRELLARTVQDQFADQRSNAGALEDIRQRMEGLEWLVKEVREREVPGMTARLDSLARHLEEAGRTPRRSPRRGKPAGTAAGTPTGTGAATPAGRAAVSDAARRWPGGIS